MKFRPAFAVLSMTLALAACGGEMPWVKKEAATEPAANGHQGPPTVSPVDQPIEVTGETREISTAEASTMGTKLFRAGGQGWVATAGDSSVVYERPGQKSVGVTTRRMTYARGVEFIGVMSGRPFSLNIQAAECTDGAGAKHPFTARLSAAGNKLTGCAQATDTMPKAQIKASSATAKPKAAKPKAAKPAAATTPKPADAAPASTPENTPATTVPTTTPTAPTSTTPVTTAPATTTGATTSTTTGTSNAAETSATTSTTTAPAATTTTTETPAATTTPPAPVVTAPAAPEAPAATTTTPAAPAASTTPAPVLPTPSTTEGGSTN